ncbi:hypothetical protein ACFLZX_04115 [Nanoarchaeota archaeon]
MNNAKWTKEDVDKTVKIILRAKEKRTSFVRFLDQIVYLSVFIVALIINFVISIVLVPILVVFHGFWLYVMIAILAFSFGLLFEVLIRDIENLEIRHHVLNIIAIPSIAVINLLIIGAIAVFTRDTLLLNLPHHPLVEGLVYAVFFILPYLYRQFFKKRRFK